MSVNVWLVGAGPGDPDLLTVKAARLLAAADVVVHDALVGDGVLALVPAATELIDVGKRPGRPVPQELISTLLVTLARDGKRVVRLKGGDPFVFGRGGEEAQALVDAGIPFEVVPGITSAVAAPAAAGVPVTHRGVAASFTVVTGHRRAGEPDVDWRALARVGGTLVVLMGVSQRATIAAELIAGGLDPATPVAAVQSATTDGQVTTRCRVDELAVTPVESPAVLVIGAVAALELTGVTESRLAASALRTRASSGVRAPTIAYDVASTQPRAYSRNDRPAAAASVRTAASRAAPSPDAHRMLRRRSPGAVASRSKSSMRNPEASGDHARNAAPTSAHHWRTASVSGG